MEPLPSIRGGMLFSGFEVGEGLDASWSGVDANTRRGFCFVLRKEPFEQYLRDHPDGHPS